MRNFLHFILTVSICLSLNHQILGQTTTKPKTPASSPSYVKISVFDEKISEINGRINSLSNSIGGVRGYIGKKLDSFYILDAKIDTIVQTLNDYNIKMNLNQNSLRMTSSEILAFKELTEKNHKAQDVMLSQLRTQLSLAFIAIGILLAGLIAVFVLLMKKISKQGEELQDSFAELSETLEGTIEETKETVKTAAVHEIDSNREVFETKLAGIKTDFQLNKDAVANIMKTTNEDLSRKMSEMQHLLLAKIQQVNRDLTEKVTHLASIVEPQPENPETEIPKK